MSGGASSHTLGAMPLVTAPISPRRSSWFEVRALATAKLENIDLKLRHLTAMRQALQVLVEACACEGREPVCPIIEVLNRA
jgi:Zn-dependent protease with chaperone function